jgi:hypothetical protein
MACPDVIEKHFPGVAVHGCIMAIVKGGDRQVVHEKIRVWRGSLRAFSQLATIAE